ncbi:hypothetical protein P691DRAFT_813470 [Macrolepiota fuliginosa MF-IS2]|uniref:F-box domain-containing protein n=1 Tax=Macrolepiota fuliginosa MF-IS2 TaxID=1400762 RepID=A0A9P6C2G8_9AGAR|nr:hypothetical protein P691DRAFT_813470 [Macrolepiota fuliginosa MF-IS2]
MNTTTTRSSARLLKKYQAAAQITSTTQNKKRPAPTPSINATSKPSSQKRRKVNHDEAEGLTIPKVSLTPRPDARVRGRRGQLKHMTEMPMDVLYEIFQSLEPIDLLHLSWANKSLHSIIMGESARYLWEDAFQALYSSEHAPPSCPSDLNLAQYTKLLFDKRCMECNSPHGSHVVWPHRLRVCGNCLEGDLFTVLTAPHRYWQTIPMMRTFVHGRYQTYVLASEFSEVRAKTDSLSSDTTEWKEYLRQRGEWMTARRQDEWKFAQWQREQKRDRKTELEEVRIKRRNEIVVRLGDLGWKEELDHLNNHQLWTLPGVRIAKPLTDKAWEALCPELIDHLEAVKVLRLEREKQTRIVRRCESLSKKISAWAKQQSRYDTMPKTLDVALGEPFNSYILSGSDSEPTFITDSDKFGKALGHFAEEWNESRNQFLASLLPKSVRGAGKASAKGKGRADISTKALELATTFFQCSSCVEPISYPRVLAHECLRQPCTSGNRRDSDPETLQALSITYFPRPWMCDCEDLTFDQEASEIARAIVQVCGENPDELTAERMDEMDCRLECTRCSEPKKGRWVMKWRMAVLHELEKHCSPSDEFPLASPRRGKKRVKQPADDRRWCLVTDADDLTWVRSREEGNAGAKPYITCKQCRNNVASNLQNMQMHWNNFHCYPEGENGHTFYHQIPGIVAPEKFPIPEENELRAMFESPLDHSIKSTHVNVRIPIRKQAEDVKME